MSLLYSSVLGSIARPGFNVFVNSAAAYGMGKAVKETYCRDIALIVVINTVFRIAMTHVLTAMKIPYQKEGSGGPFLFGCLTLIAQPLSVETARRLFKVDPKWNTRLSFVTIFAYIAWGWKVNGMVKDLLFILVPSIKRV